MPKRLSFFPPPRLSKLLEPRTFRRWLTRLAERVGPTLHLARMLIKPASLRPRMAGLGLQRLTEVDHATPQAATAPKSERAAKPVDGFDPTEQILRTKLQRVAAAGISAIVGVLMTLIGWGLFALAFHVLMPLRWAYLTAEQLEAIRTYLGVLLVSGLLSDYAKRLLSR